ncbi:MAG: hypothetical protein GTO02_15645 [Candidatus Dadabacteria bacterium]|nr:hypothetical protein [Candidatus Dadabacteria bacterium]NIQ15768.1 hypothetical protein [Candidatus Dadabacteria bacterium]
MTIKIDVLENGPLIVDNLPRLVNSKNKEVPIDEKIALCRCGKSRNKPFCDGTHKKIGFSGERERKIPLTNEKEYTGREINVYDNRAICCHATQCISNLRSVFDINSRPWVNPDNGSAERIINVIKKCPSGALSYSVDGVHQRDFEREAQIKINKNGPYEIVGYVELDVPDEIQPPSKEHYSLCRCGASKNKPYCDGSHYTINFKEEDI